MVERFGRAAGGRWAVNLEVARGEGRRVTVKKANPIAVSRRRRSARHRKMCQTKPIRNQRKIHCRWGLNRPCPSLRVKRKPMHSGSGSRTVISGQRSVARGQ